MKFTIVVVSLLHIAIAASVNYGAESNSSCFISSESLQDFREIMEDITARQNTSTEDNPCLCKLDDHRAIAGCKEVFKMLQCGITTLSRAFITAVNDFLPEGPPMYFDLAYGRLSNLMELNVNMLRQELGGERYSDIKALQQFFRSQDTLTRVSDKLFEVTIDSLATKIQLGEIEEDDKMNASTMMSPYWIGRMIEKVFRKHGKDTKLDNILSFIKALKQCSNQEWAFIAVVQIMLDYDYNLLYSRNMQLVARAVRESECPLRRIRPEFRYKFGENYGTGTLLITQNGENEVH